MKYNTLATTIGKRTLWQYAVGVLGILLVSSLIAWHRTSAPVANSTVLDATSHVQLSTVADLSAQAGPLSLVGQVTSLSQANILAQSAGQVVSLLHANGDYVAAGSLIGTLENSSQQAAVTQAQGAFEAAQASLAKVQGPTALSSGISSMQAATAAQNAASSLVAALSSAYASFDDAIHTRADTLFINPGTYQTSLVALIVSNQQLVIDVNNERSALNAALDDANSAASTIDTTDVESRTTRVLADGNQVRAFLDALVETLNKAVPNNLYSVSQIAAYQTSMSAARSEVVGAISSVISARAAYEAALTSSQSASNLATAGSGSDIAVAEASLKSAQGALDAAKANLEKTIIRSPISGIIVSLPVNRGDFITMNQQVASVSNPQALYVDTEVTPNDAKTLSIGGGATVEGVVSGVITFIAPALDPLTAKIEVKIGLRGTNTLIDGESVALALARSTHTAASGGPTTIPISSIKVTPQGASVFTIAATSSSTGALQSTLVSTPVTLGSILGDRVVVSGIAPTVEIVTDARGLSEGQNVIVDSSPPAAN